MAFATITFPATIFSFFRGISPQLQMKEEIGLILGIKKTVVNLDE